MTILDKLDIADPTLREVFVSTLRKFRNVHHQLERNRSETRESADVEALSIAPMQSGFCS
jgi:hypothetical protein